MTSDPVCVTLDRPAAQRAGHRERKHQSHVGDVDGDGPRPGGGLRSRAAPG